MAADEMGRERLDFLVFLCFFFFFPYGMYFLLEKMQSPWRLELVILNRVCGRLPDASFKGQVLVYMRPKCNELSVKNNNIPNFYEML